MENAQVDLLADVALKAPLDSPTFTGTVTGRVFAFLDDNGSANGYITSETNGPIQIIQFGVDDAVIEDVHLTSADRTGADGKAASITINPGRSNGTDQGAAYLLLAGGRGTGAGGTATTGNIFFQTPVIGVSGSTDQGYATRWQMDVNGFFHPALDNDMWLGQSYARIARSYIVDGRFNTATFGDAGELVVSTAGRLTWSADTYIERSAANVLTTGDLMQSTLGFQVPAATGNYAYRAHQGAGASWLGNFLTASDTQPAYRVLGDGTTRWGAGGSTAFDTNLYRSAADKLKTDDMFITTVGLGVGNSAAATALGTVTRKAQVFDAAGASLGYLPIYDAIT